MARNKVQNKISREELSELYIVQFKSTREIARIFNCNATTIGDLLKRYGLPPRPVGSGRKVQIVKIEHPNGGIDAKRCTVCNDVKPLVDFNICRKSSGGRQPKCIVCRKNYYSQNRENIIAKSRLNYYKNHDKNKLMKRLYYLSNKEQISNYNKVKYYSNHEKYLLINRNRYHKNKEKILAQQRLRRAENIEDKREQERKRYVKRKEQRLIYHKKYYTLNKGSILLNAKKRKKFVKALPFTLTTQQWEKIIKEFKNRCALSMNDSELNMEHFIPTSWGHGGTYEGNVYPLHWRINRSKSDINPFVWIERDDVKAMIDLDKWCNLVNYIARKNKLTVEELRDFVNWCEKNKRKANKVGIYKRTSIEIWKDTVITNT